MIKDYELVVLPHVSESDRDSVPVAFIKKKYVKEVVLMVACVRNLQRRVHQDCLLVSQEYRGPLTANPVGIVAISDVFTLMFLYDTRNIKVGEALIMHELGHYLLGHHKIDPEVYSILRNGSDGVLPTELEADKFAVSQCGPDQVINMLYVLIYRRKKLFNETKSSPAVKELLLRIARIREDNKHVE